MLQHKAGLLLIEGYIVLLLAHHAALLVGKALNMLALHYGTLYYLLAVADLYLGIQPAFGLYAHKRAHLAKAVAAALFKSYGFLMLVRVV